MEEYQPLGAQLWLLDIAQLFKIRVIACLLADGSFRKLLEQHQITVKVLTHQTIQVCKDSNLPQGLGSLAQLVPFIYQVTQLSREYDLIYANTQKAPVVGAIASVFSRRPLIYHLHDIVSLEHFSEVNRQLIVTMANCFASLVIANSKASQKAFAEAKGRVDLTEVGYNGFAPGSYINH